jgi:hypothetical protein
MSLLLILSLAGVIVLIPSALTETRRVLPLLVLSYAVCQLISPINSWTSLDESYRKSTHWRTGTILTVVGVTVLVVASVSAEFLLW